KPETTIARSANTRRSRATSPSRRASRYSAANVIRQPYHPASNHSLLWTCGPFSVVLGRQVHKPFTAEISALREHALAAFVWMPPFASLRLPHMPTPSHDSRKGSTQTPRPFVPAV